jgi:hypothetical protein
MSKSDTTTSLEMSRGSSQIADTAEVDIFLSEGIFRPWRAWRPCASPIAVVGSRLILETNLAEQPRALKVYVSILDLRAKVKVLDRRRYTPAWMTSSPNLYRCLTNILPLRG